MISGCTSLHQAGATVAGSNPRQKRPCRRQGGLARTVPQPPRQRIGKRADNFIRHWWVCLRPPSTVAPSSQTSRVYVFKKSSHFVFSSLERRFTVLVSLNVLFAD
ncbi:hypothetical protein PoB_007553200 [Plakobranchus ocellatus]|uniref:Uncharacterized protein n=1 Tax=Plakobranchus ocellatus TaxID=259542 RepID=A0AAV4DYB8_9GAST|nr:hypothetical protein PoB_007553200 [Plakobranchus ocellatus]